MSNMTGVLRVIPLLLILLQAEGLPAWNGTQQALKTKWSGCHFSPNGTKTEEMLEVCTKKPYDKEDPEGIPYVCMLYANFVIEMCKEGSSEDIKKKAQEMTDLDHVLMTRFKLCDAQMGVRIPDRVRDVLHGEICTSTCAWMAAEKLCRVLVVFALTDYPTLEKAAEVTWNETRTTTAAPPGTVTPTAPQGGTGGGDTKTTSAPTVTENGGTSNDSTPTDTGETHPIGKDKTSSTDKDETPSTDNDKTPKEKDKPKKDATSQPTVPVGSITYGKLVIYGGSFLAVGLFVFFVYRYRQTILFCLRDTEGGSGSPPPSDGKGSYRKIPNFERMVPSMEDREKAKNFIY